MRARASAWWRWLFPGLAGALGLGLALPRASGCFVEERCYGSEDCPQDFLCDDGLCVFQGFECVVDEDCGGLGFRCVDQVCVFECLEGELSCPDDMADICGTYCIDIWEASRPDATEESGGSDSSMALSQPGVIPWYSSDYLGGMNQEIASAACEAAGKRLCTPQEWEAVCRGPDDLEYCYGDDYSASICNGIDTFCDCDGDGQPDGDGAYPHCRQECDTDLHVVPTGSFADCTNDFGIFDVNGNVWEIVSTDDGINHYRGGAYNCSDSEKLHNCGYDGAESGSFPSAKGFRCCADGEPGP